jgi:hypothetical protein
MIVAFDLKDFSRKEVAEAQNFIWNALKNPNVSYSFLAEAVGDSEYIYMEGLSKNVANIIFEICMRNI